MNSTNALRTEEAWELLRSLDSGDPITRQLVHTALNHFLRRFEAERDRPIADFDLLWFLELMTEMFSRHNYLRQVLAGERPGAFYDDE